MKRIVLVAFVCGQIVLSAQTTPAPRKSQMFDSAALLSDLKTLSSDEMNGRAVDSPDSAKARAFLVERLKAAGLKPFGNSFEQPFTFTTGGRAGSPVVERKGVNLVGEVRG